MILHIVFDGHIGIAAIPLDVPGAKRVKSAIRDFYQTYELALYEKAYSHFFNTQDSIPNLLNFSSKPKQAFYFGSFHSGDSLKQNLFFRNAAAKGYRIFVQQTDYIDFCTPDGIEIDACRTSAGVTLLGIDKTALAPTPFIGKD